MSKKATQIEKYVIEAVRKKRLESGLSQKELSLRLSVDVAFVGHVESQNAREKYNLNHLNEITKVLNCSFADLFPETGLSTDCIEEYNKLHPTKRQGK